MSSAFQNPWISRVQIKNFRNFLDVDVVLSHKQVIVGENNVGKTNFIKALQLILDKDYSDNDRQLAESDFHDSIEDPLDSGEEIVIVIQIQGYEHNQKLVAQLTDAAISDAPPTLQITYRFYPIKDEDENILDYKFIIFKGNDESRRFTNEDRAYLNIFVTKALRDVERELKAGKKSPLYKLVKQYEIAQEDLEDISDSLSAAAEAVVELDEIVHIKESLTDRFSLLSGVQVDSDITLRTFDVDTERLLYTLQVYMGIKQRPISELSLGLANVLYVSLMLLLLKDRTIKPVLKEEQHDDLLKKDVTKILRKTYDKSEQGKYILKNDLSEEDLQELYQFMDENNHKPQAFTILVIEEPEAHLHPILQRLIYKEVLHNSHTSVIFTTHSTFITSVAPLNTIVHIRRVDESSQIFSTAKLQIDDGEKQDVERYLDAKRGEIYLAKGIVIVEGITEEYLVPATANLIDMPLDQYGVVVCNINSTNFKPYVKVLDALGIPWVLITDGDFYQVVDSKDAKTGKTKSKKIFHLLEDDPSVDNVNYLGHNIIGKLLIDLGKVDEDKMPEDFPDQDKVFQKFNCYVGRHTFEVDMMLKSKTSGLAILKETFEQLKPGGEEMQENFEEALDDKAYWQALSKIEGNIGKGRFAQRLASKIILDMIPDYVKKAVGKIIKVVVKEYE